MLKGFFIAVLSLYSFSMVAQTYPMYVGTYTSNGSKGVYVYDFNEKNAATKFVKAIPLPNPSFLARKDDILYVVQEESKGAVTAYDLKKNQVLNTLPTNGAHPCHVSVSPIDPLLVVSNYSGGSLVLYSTNKDGSLAKQEDFLQFDRSSINKERQQHSHIHSAFFSPDGKFVYVSDLGGDLIYKIAVKQEQAAYKFQIVDEIKVKAGGGPRHLAISADGRCLYAVLELTGEIEVLENSKDQWHSKQLIPIYKEGFVGEQGAGDIKLSADGKFIYATNRGESNEIVVYAVGKQGLLSTVQIESVNGVSPRNVQLSPQGRWVLVSNQITGALSLFGRDVKTGKLTAMPVPIEIPSAVCTIF